MAHLKVHRGNISLENWSSIVFARLNKVLYKRVHDLEGWKSKSVRYIDGRFDDIDTEFSSIKAGDIWGGPNVTTLFTITFDMPENLIGEEVYFHLLTAGEVIIKVNGKYINGVDPNRQDAFYSQKAEKGTQVVELEAYYRSRPDDIRNTTTNTSLVGCVHYFEQPQLVVIDREVQSLMYDLHVVHEMLKATLIPTDLKEVIKDRVQGILKRFPLYDCSEEILRASVPLVAKYIKDEIYSLKDVFGKTGLVGLVGHSHLDIAYFWTADQTTQKNARTTLIQLDLMDRYPDFIYGHTQSYVYETLEQNYPELFERLKEKVKEGQWEIIGGMYVEPDCNLINAESFARQVLYGKLYFREKFDVDVRLCYMPDVFGCNAIMPQILKQSGIDYFLTHKQAIWNDTNKFPYNIFHWKGIDGSKVDAVMPPVHFVAWMDTDMTIESFQQHKQKSIYPETLQLFGYGDGGSGVTEEMLEVYTRQQELPFIPHQKMTSNHDYFDRVFKSGKEYPVWNGDLYLEVHRGTYTSKATLKKLNRYGEVHASAIEALCTMATLQKNMQYPKDALTFAWKKLLLNQFHDILPGSHIPPVYDEALANYDAMYDTLKSIHAKAFEMFVLKGNDNNFVIVNTHGGSDKKIVYITKEDWNENHNALQDNNGNIYPVQKQCRVDGEERYVAILPNIRLFEFIQYTSVSSSDCKNILKVSTSTIDSPYYTVSINEKCEITGIFDKVRKSDVGEKGRVLNDWQMYEDKPGSLNAWDIMPYYQDQPVVLENFSNAEVIETGPVSVAVRMKRTVGKSSVVQIIRAYAEKSQIDFETWIDWKEEEKVLKTAFPLCVQTRNFTVDTSSGGLVHSSHNNTTWEQARFETLCHKWVDVSETGLGVAIMSDSKYGCDVFDGTVRLTLLKAPVSPDPFSDIHEHIFTYSLYTHDGNYGDSELDNDSLDLSYPLYATKGLVNEKNEVPFTIEGSLSLLAFKMAEDGSGDYIIRLHEVRGKRGNCSLKFNIPIKSVHECSILEEREQEREVVEKEVCVAYAPHKIVTLRVVTQ